MPPDTLLLPSSELREAIQRGVGETDGVILQVCEAGAAAGVGRVERRGWNAQGNVEGVGGTGVESRLE